MTSLAPARIVAIVGAGPAGLMAAEALQAAGHEVHVFDAMPSAGRKFLLAGVGGLNLTHSEPRKAFVRRYGPRALEVERWLAVFGADDARAWARGLGHETFVGTSGRVFPVDMKAAPLLRAWLHRLRAATDGGRPVQFHMRHRWDGRLDAGGGASAPGMTDPGDGSALDFRILSTPRAGPARPAPRGGASRVAEPHRLMSAGFRSPSGAVRFDAHAWVLALGGASWPRLGSDGAWAAALAARGVDIAPLQPGNCGFDVAPTAPGRDGWSEHLREHHAGAPIKPVAMTVCDDEGEHRQQGEFVLTRTGIEGSLVYAFSARLREGIARHGRATVALDLLPQHDFAHVLAEVRRPRGARSLSTHLKSRLGLQGAKVALLHELLSDADLHAPEVLARAIKSLPVPLAAPRPVEEAISTAGGVRLEGLDDGLMLHVLPGVFCAGEMLDWEAPTGGYLLTACLASGRVAARGVSRWLAGPTRELSNIGTP